MADKSDLIALLKEIDLKEDQEDSEDKEDSVDREEVLLEVQTCSWAKMIRTQRRDQLPNSKAKL